MPNKDNVLSFLEDKTNTFSSRVALGMRNSYGWSEFTYQGLGVMSRKIAAYLLEELMVKKEEHVAILSESRIEFGAAFFASVIAGTTFIPLDIKLTNHKDWIKEDFNFYDYGCHLSKEKYDYLTKKYFDNE